MRQSGFCRSGVRAATAGCARWRLETPPAAGFDEAGGLCRRSGWYPRRCHGLSSAMQRRATRVRRAVLSSAVQRRRFCDRLYRVGVASPTVCRTLFPGCAALTRATRVYGAWRRCCGLSSAMQRRPTGGFGDAGGLRCRSGWHPRRCCWLSSAVQRRPAAGFCDMLLHVTRSHACIRVLDPG